MKRSEVEAFFARVLAGFKDDEPGVLIFEDVEETTLEFSASKGDRVEWTGRLFRAGDYGRKGSYDTERLKLFISSFPPEGVPIKDTHIAKPTFFNELLKRQDVKVSRVWLSDDGQEVHGAGDAPKWLEEGIRDAMLTKKVSVGLNDTGTSIKEVSLVLNPHVEDAALFERDMAKAFSASPDFAEADEETKAAVLALAPEPKTPAPAPARTEGNNTTMTLQEKSKAGLSLLTPDQRASIGLTEADIETVATFSAPETKPDPRDLAFARNMAKSKAESLTRDGFAFDQEAFTRLYTGACKQDGGGTITFSEDGDLTTGQAVQDVVKLVTDTKKVPLGLEGIPSFSKEDDKGADKGVWEGFDAKKHLGVKN